MNMNLRDHGGITYRYYQGNAVYPFGFGLSYTTFEYKWMDGIGDKKWIGEMTRYTVIVTNTGKQTSDCVVLGFMAPANGTSNGLLKKLFDFARIKDLKPGMNATVHLSVALAHVQAVDRKGNIFLPRGISRVWVGDADTQFLTGSLAVN